MTHDVEGDTAVISVDEQERRLRLGCEMVGRLQSQLYDRLLAVAA